MDFASSAADLLSGGRARVVELIGPVGMAVKLRVTLSATTAQPGLAASLLAAPFADFVVTLLGCGILQEWDDQGQSCTCVPGASGGGGLLGGVVDANGTEESRSACACSHGWAPQPDGSGCRMQQQPDAPLPVGTVAALSASFSAVACGVCTLVVGVAALRRGARRTAVQNVEKLMIPASDLTRGLFGRAHALATATAASDLAESTASSSIMLSPSFRRFPAVGQHVSRAFGLLQRSRARFATGRSRYATPSMMSDALASSSASYTAGMLLRAGSAAACAPSSRSGGHHRGQQQAVRSASAAIATDESRPRKSRSADRGSTHVAHLADAQATLVASRLADTQAAAVVDLSKGGVAVYRGASDVALIRSIRSDDDDTLNLSVGRSLRVTQPSVVHAPERACQSNSIVAQRVEPRGTAAAWPMPPACMVVRLSSNLPFTCARSCGSGGGLAERVAAFWLLPADNQKPDTMCTPLVVARKRRGRSGDHLLRPPLARARVLRLLVLPRTKGPCAGFVGRNRSHGPLLNRNA